MVLFNFNLKSYRTHIENKNLTTGRALFSANIARVFDFFAIVFAKSKRYMPISGF